MSKIFDKAAQGIDNDVKRFVDKSFDIVDQIHSLLEEKKISQRELAQLLNKKESEISKWLSGTHNFTLRSISKIESILNEDIISTPLKAKKKYYTVKFVPVKTYARLNRPNVTSENYKDAGVLETTSGDSGLSKVA